MNIRREAITDSSNTCTVRRIIVQIKEVKQSLEKDQKISKENRGFVVHIFDYGTMIL